MSRFDKTYGCFIDKNKNDVRACVYNFTFQVDLKSRDKGRSFLSVSSIAALCLIRFFPRKLIKIFILAHCMSHSIHRPYFKTSSFSLLIFHVKIQMRAK
jgi:hypothetical protein